MDAALQDAALQARAEQIGQADQWFDDDFFDWVRSSCYICEFYTLTSLSGQSQGEAR